MNDNNDKQAVRELAAAIYARLPNKTFITESNRLDARRRVEMSIEHAELFYLVVKQNEASKEEK